MHRLVAVVLLIAAATVATACASLNSTTSIEPGQAFRLGGGQPGAFTVRGRNAGNVPVTVFAERDGQRDSVTTLAPGAPVDARFPASATAIFANRSTTSRAAVSIKVTGDVRALGMRYEPVKTP